MTDTFARLLLLAWVLPLATLEAGCARDEASLEATGCGTVDDACLRTAAERPAEWIAHGGTYAEQRYSPLDRIHQGNVGQLGLAWSFATGTRRGLEATPLVHDGTLYTTGSWSVVYAIDARTGHELWRFDPEVPRAFGIRACCDVVNRGVALYRGHIYLGTLDGRLVALDAETGQPSWTVQTTDLDQPYTITGAPRIVKGRVVIGNGGAEYGVRGYVSAYDATTGALDWRFYTVPGDPALPFESAAMERAAATWNGEWWKAGGGGTVWDSMAYDPELDLLYVGTGNGSPWVHRLRSPGGGDNLYLSSILALRPDTGELVWHYQTTPGDTWDYTATQHIVLAQLDIDGRERRVLMQAPKNGFFYVLDRGTGELLSAQNFVDVSWASHIDLSSGRPVELPGARYAEGPSEIRPGPTGAHSWQPMAYNPGTGLVYIPASEIPFTFAEDPDYQHRQGSWNMGIDQVLGATSMGSGPVAGHLLAWDPVAQRVVWRVAHTSAWNGGVLTTAGDLVFQGDGRGSFAAYRASDGERLFSAPAGTGVVAPPITYELDGEQYVAVMAGWGGGFALASADPPPSTLAGANAGHLLVFKLGGQAALPAAIPRPRELAAIEADLDPAAIARGHDTYHRWCVACHGPAAIGGGTVADLRYGAPATFDALEEIVLRGALEPSGMPNLGRWLGAPDIADLRAYLLQRRHELRESLAAPES